MVRDPVEELKALKQQPGKTIFVFGSAELADSLAKAGLVDEYRICLVPVMLGGGNPPNGKTANGKSSDGKSSDGTSSKRKARKGA